MEETAEFLNSKGFFCFTVSANGKNITCIHYLVIDSRGPNFYFVFVNNKLVKITRTNLHYGKDNPIDSIINAADMSTKQLQDLLADHREFRKKHSGENSFPGFMYWLSWMGRIDRYKAFEHNTELSKIYDGRKIQLGMNSTEVNEIFGEPLEVGEVEHNSTMRIYGKIRKLAALGPYRFSPVCVLYIENKVVGVWKSSMDRDLIHYINSTR